MAGKSDYLEGKVLDHIFGLASFSAPATVYMALFTATPGDSGGGTEVTGGSYVRKAVTNDNTQWSRTGDTVTNLNAIDFVTPTADWGIVGWVGVYDASTSGNLLFWAALLSTQDIHNTDPVGFAPGSLTFVED